MDAVGMFVVDVLPDDANQDQTFLVGTEQSDKIAVADVRVAAITVTSHPARVVR